MRLAPLALRLLARDWKSGELRVLVLALVVAVASVGSVGFFSDRVARALDRQAGQLLAADLVLVSDHPVAPAVEEEARRRGLEVASHVSFPSMVVGGAASRLAEVKAVSAGYPLRGALRTAPRPFAAETQASGPPPRGSAWLDPRLLADLGLAPGDSLQLGGSALRVAAVLAYEPDRGGSFFSIAPRLMINADDLSATGLVQPGSRLSYRLLVAGEAEAVDGFRAWAKPRLERGQRLEDVREARPEMRTALERADRFLGLAALASVVLAGAAIVLAARRFTERHLDSCAVMRCLGAPQGDIFRLYLLEFAVLGALGSLAGALLGWLAHGVLAQAMAGFIVAELPPPSWRPALTAIATGLATLLAFALPPLARLRQVPTLRVLRRDLGPPPARTALGMLLGLALLAALVLHQAGDLKLGGYVLGGLAAAVAAAAALALGAIRLLGPLRQRAGAAWRYGLASVARRRGQSVAQAVAFALGLMVLLTLTLVRGQLMEGWRESLPPQAPNRFLINIQPDQVSAVERFLAERGISDPGFYPMVRGRLTAISGRPVRGAEYDDERARRLAEREFNLSWAERPQRDNRIVAGRWWGAGQRGQRQFSVEQGLAQTLGIRLGDTLSFEMAGASVTGPVTSLRKVEWDSFNANFFVLAPPGVLDAFPASYITSFHLPAGAEATLEALVRAFPNVTVIDVAALMERVRGVMDRVSSAVEFVFLFTLAAGVMVLWAGIAATQDERLREAAILRALGAGRQRLMQGHAAEFIAVGLIAGLVAATGASGLGYFVATRVLNLPYAFDPALWAWGLGAGAGGVTLFGLLATRRILDHPPQRVLQGG